MLADEYKLLKGDCLQLMQNIPDNSIDMVLCDLPYGTTACKWDTVIQFEPLWAQYERVIKDNGSIVLFSSEPFTSALIMSNIKLFRYDLIWQKEQGTDFLNANRKPLKAHENICIFYKKQPTYNKQYGIGKPYKAVNGNKGIPDVWGTFKTGMNTDSDGRRCPVSILNYKRERGLHPTQKPVQLLEYLMRTYTNKGETVLDNCMGSGSTGVACINTGRRFIGIELDTNYFSIAQERIEKATKNKQVELWQE